MPILAGLVMLLAQDPDARYREALFHEVDSGELQKAIDVYQAIESDAAAPEAIRAKAAFRRAWCLEKKGRRAEAEAGYRGLATKYPGQAETVEKAKERLDRLVTGAAPAAPVSQEQRIADHILNLGSGTESASTSQRALVLIGEPAVPQLRKAMEHKDVTLSAMAATVLVALEKDEGTYAPLIRRLRRERNQYYGALSELLKRSQPDRKRLVEDFNAERDPKVIERFLGLLGWVDVPEVRPRLRDLVVEADDNLAGEAADLLAPAREDELVDLLEKLVKKGPKSARVQALLGASELTVTDPKRLARLVTTLLPDFGEGEVKLGRISPYEDVVRECGLAWLRSDRDRVREDVLRWMLRAHPYRMALSLLGEPLREGDRVTILAHLGSKDGPPDAGTKAAVEKALWEVVEKERGEVQRTAVLSLDTLIDPEHPRWEELLAWEFKSMRSVDWIANDFRRFSPEVQERARRVIRGLMKKGDGDAVRLNALKAAQRVNDPDRFAALAELALDESMSEEVRRVALVDLVGAPNLKDFAPRLVPLLKSPIGPIRRQTAKTMHNWRDPEAENLMLPLLVDPDPLMSQAAVEWFKTAPRDENMDAFFKAFLSGSPLTRTEAAKVTGTSETLRAVPHLIELLDDSSPSVRDAARGALERIRKRHEEKAQWLEWYERVKPK